MSDFTSDKKREVKGYVVGVYGLTTASHVKLFLQRLHDWYGVEKDTFFVWAYRPELGSIALGCTPDAFLKLVEYALPLMFMEDYISAFKVAALYEPKREVQIRCYNRDENGRRYRWFKYKYDKHRRKQRVYIDPEPQPVEAAQAA